MKTILLSLLVLFIFGAEALAQDTPPYGFETYYSSGNAYRITIESHNGTLTVLEVPQGVMVNVAGSMEQNPLPRAGSGLPHTFRGDLIIRTRRADEIEATESSRSAEIMSQAPLELALTNAVVTIAVVEEEEDR